MSDWQVIGRQKFRVTDDLVHWDVLADIEVFELDRVLQECVAVQAVYGYTLLLLTTAGGSWAFPPPARRHLAEFHRHYTTSGATALVGASPAATVILDLVLRAVSLVHGYRPATRFFRLREEADAWLEEQRALGQQGLLRRKK